MNKYIEVLNRIVSEGISQNDYNLVCKALERLVRYESIYENKKLKISDFISYTKSHMDLDIESFDDSESYIKSVLYAAKDLNQKSVHKRIKRERLRKDISDIESSLVKGDTYSLNEGGYNNGYRPNIVADKLTQKLELREELGAILISNLIYDQQQTYLNSMLEKLIKMLPTRTHDETLLLEFVDGLKECDVAIELGYPTDTIIKRRNAGIKALAMLIDNLLKTQKK